MDPNIKVRYCGYKERKKLTCRSPNDELPFKWARVGGGGSERRINKCKHKRRVLVDTSVLVVSEKISRRSEANKQIKIIIIKNRDDVYNFD